MPLAPEQEGAGTKSEGQRRRRLTQRGKRKLAEEWSTELAVAEHTGGLTCASLRHLCREAGMLALREDIGAMAVASHFMRALLECKRKY
jgi:ATP-dependent 26S proteasome regulatory subunit